MDSGRGKEVRNTLSLCWSWLLDGFVPSQTHLFLWAREKQRLGALDTGFWSLLTLNFALVFVVSPLFPAHGLIKIS